MARLLNYDFTLSKAWATLGLMAKKKKATWGGAREGAGRPPLNRDLVRFSLDLERPTHGKLRQIAFIRLSELSLPVGQETATVRFDLPTDGADAQKPDDDDVSRAAPLPMARESQGS